MTTVNSRYRLGNQVVLVHGKHASALYDLFDGRIQRISNGLGEELSLEASALSEESLSANGGVLQSIVDKLLDRKFLEEHRKNAPERYSFDHKVPRFPPLRTISFELGSSTQRQDISKSKKLISEASADFSLGAFAFLVQEKFSHWRDLEKMLLAVLNSHKYVLCEFWCRDSEILESLNLHQLKTKFPGRILEVRVCESESATVGISEEGIRLLWDWRANLSPSVLNCRPDFYHLLKNYSESYGCLHFDEKWLVFPDVSERHYSIGNMHEFKGIKDLLESERIMHYWQYNKDKREKCCDCELRYACPNPLSQRLSAGTLNSGPSNCDYDMERGAW